MSKRLHLFASLLAAALAVTGCATLDTWQRKAIFQHEASVRHADLGPPAHAEAFDLQLRNGDTVHAWYLPAEDADAPTVLYLHGARRNLNGSMNRIDRLRSLGFNVLAIDYRGFGRSTPMLPSEASSIEDARAAWAELQRRQPDPGRRFVYGYSLGGAIAIALAGETEGVTGVMVESTFTSIPDLVRQTRWRWVPFVSLAVTQDFDSIGRVRRVSEPLLFIHGTRDGVIPHTMSDELAAAAARVPVELRRVVKIEGASHRGAPYVGADSFDAAVREFVRAAADHAAARWSDTADTSAAVR
jgi:pimeloyl-ACP methyl ester carboxylesterase